ncbi:MULTISPECIES: carbohydrate ABC transporter permease [Microbacterium]|uniref:carbohydrate ABC transporter permease n=1 Tax=Microbacterium TaxID=33882 RepID=UPI001E42CA1D|nr:carbohydrate ABC transporter permease [Microbacterium nymphoidis]MCD2498661.1 carbohydrate ABC transporter permease [Microbacterium nymphoidis]
MSSRVARRRTVRTLQYLALAGFLIFLGFPLLWLLSTAFKSSAEINSLSVNLIPAQPTIDNFIAAFERQGLPLAAWNSLVVAVATTILTTAISIPGAYVMARYKGRMRAVGVGYILVSQIFPVILVIIPLFFILRSAGLVDSLIGLIVVYTVYTLPFSLWMLQGYVSAIPFDIEEAASIDGASKFTAMRTIVFPLLMPGIVATAMFSFVSAYNEFFFALVLLQSPEHYTLPIALATFVGGEGKVAVGPLAAGALLASIPSIIFFSLLQKRLAKGLISGAVKG